PPPVARGGPDRAALVGPRRRPRPRTVGLRLHLGLAVRAAALRRPGARRAAAPPLATADRDGRRRRAGGRADAPVRPLTPGRPHRPLPARRGLAGGPPLPGERRPGVARLHQRVLARLPVRRHLLDPGRRVLRPAGPAPRRRPGQPVAGPPRALLAS